MLDRAVAGDEVTVLGRKIVPVGIDPYGDDAVRLMQPSGLIT